MRKLKVISVVGTRPEIIRLSRIFSSLEKHCDHTLVHTGQNYDYKLNQVFFDELDLKKPDIFLNCAEGSKSACNTIGNLITAIDQVLNDVKPDSMLVLGDTNSCLSILAAKRRKIPTFHLEAGNRCFDFRVPEEINRRIVDHVADINLTYSSIAKEYLLREGLPPDQIIKIGSPMYEVIHHYLDKVKVSKVLEKLNLFEGKYFLISVHREENIDSQSCFLKVVEIINTIAEKFSLPVILSTHPRTLKKINILGIKFNSLVSILEPFGFVDYIKLQINSKVVLSDSGTINEESSILNFPALNLRESHERPEGMEEGSVMLTGLSIERVLQSMKILDHQSRGNIRDLKIVSDYDITNVSAKVVRILHSYTDYVNRVVWKKY